ncbi:hypothetical protein BC936DRAFT_138557 [Jimgerdemannia flammicorona]|uniref:Myb-like domain-containing protein n=1 Tax=Jimgerdemannia flammicorona TaxID=994334 RepID=A0A433C4D1_9FUNG|nr:hypothetical protein BC936DRAFT_138557 [Jimgerdemannia flammicorona]
MPKVKSEPSPAPDELHSSKRQRRSRELWTPEEDAILTRERGAGKMFKEIAELLPRHDYVACKNHYFNSIQKKSGEWSTEEEATLATALAECETLRRDYWKAVAKFLPGRTWQVVEKKADEQMAKEKR